MGTFSWSSDTARMPDWQRLLRLLTSAPMSDPVVAAQPTSKAKVFFRRLTSTVILWTVVLAGMFSGNKLIADGVFALFMVVLALGWISLHLDRQVRTSAGR